MKKFEILEHKADLKIKVFGKNKEELFQNALLGMVKCLNPEVLPEKSEERDVNIISVDLGALLIDFLNEVLYLIQTNREVYNKIQFKKFNDKKIQANLRGQKIRKLGEDIKAATYHDLDVIRRKDGIWEAIILFDI